MQRKMKPYLGRILIVATYAVLLFLSFSIGVLWITVASTVFSTVLIIGLIYLDYLDRHTSRKVKQKREAQQALASHFDNIWYRPADSTELEYQREKMRKKRRH
jgi:ABC-type bacteriocin/lantibiotic exporter with double-glycine peptidase domain